MVLNVTLVCLVLAFFMEICIRVAIDKLNWNYKYKYKKKEQFVMNLCRIITIFLGGIGIGAFPNSGDDPMVWYKVILVIFMAVISGLMTYGFIDLDLCSRRLKICFGILYIFSLICSYILSYKYCQNIVITSKTIVEAEEERELLDFCNIPMQEVSGFVSGSRYGVSGKITTTDNYSYWYKNQNGEGIHDFASEANSKIVFIEDNESPYVEIIDYSTQIITIDRNNGNEKTRTDKTWTEYHFYLPKSIMQYLD